MPTPADSHLGWERQKIGAPPFGLARPEILQRPKLHGGPWCGVGTTLTFAQSHQGHDVGGVPLLVELKQLLPHIKAPRFGKAIQCSLVPWSDAKLSETHSWVIEFRTGHKKLVTLSSVNRSTT